MSYWIWPLDTREGRDLTGTLISDIVLQLLIYVAQKERESNRQQQAEGIAAAKVRGVHCGRRRMDVPEGFVDIVQDWCEGWISATNAAKELGMSRDTLAQRLGFSESYIGDTWISPTNTIINYYKERAYAFTIRQSPASFFQCYERLPQINLPSSKMLE